MWNNKGVHKEGAQNFKWVKGQNVATYLPYIMGIIELDLYIQHFNESSTESHLARFARSCSNVFYDDM